MPGSTALITTYDVGHALPADGEWPVYDGSLGRWKFTESVLLLESGGTTYLQLEDHVELRWSNGTNYVGLKGPAILSGNQTWTLPLRDGGSDEYLKTNGSGVLSFAAVKESELDADVSTIFRAYLASDDVVPIQGSYVALAFDTTDLDQGTDYTYASTSGELTLDTAGTYMVWVDVTVGQTGGSGTPGRTEFTCRLELDTGSGFAAVAGTDRYFYSRNSGEDATSATISIAVMVSASDKLRVTAKRMSASAADGLFTGGACSITVRRVA